MHELQQTWQQALLVLPHCAAVAGQLLCCLPGLLQLCEALQRHARWPLLGSEGSCLLQHLMLAHLQQTSEMN